MRSLPKDSDRCEFVSSNGRRCCMIRVEPGVPFCFNHWKKHQQQEDAARIGDEIVGAEGALNTQEGIHKALSNVFANLARNRITPRSAAVLGYVCQLMLVSLPSLERTFKSMLPMLQLSLKVGQQNKDANIKSSREVLKNALLEQEVLNGLFAQSETFRKMTPQDILSMMKFASMFTGNPMPTPGAKSSPAAAPKTTPPAPGSGS